jgi:hypothetical protein
MSDARLRLKNGIIVPIKEVHIEYPSGPQGHRNVAVNAGEFLFRRVGLNCPDALALCDAVRAGGLFDETLNAVGHETTKKSRPAGPLS